MSNRFEPAPNPLLSVLPSLKPDLHEEPLVPSNPFFGWMSPGGGDSNALLPWVDDDIGPRASTKADAEPSNPVGTGLSVIDAAHTGIEAWRQGGLSVGTLGEEAGEIFAGTASNAEIASEAANGVLGPVGIAGGIMDVIEGFGECARGNKLEGGFKIAEGGMGAASGGFGLAELAGINAATPWGLGLAAGATGLKVGRYGDRKTKELGWFHDEHGDNASASEWAGQLGRSVNDSLSDRGHPWLGSVAGAATLAGATLANVGIVPAAAAIGFGKSVGSGLAHFGKSIGSGLANHHRANHYAHYDGINEIQGGAEAMADDDDQRDAAIERSKREHPERWGQLTAGQWVAKYAGGGK
jgi:hypothetical protein